MVVNLKSIKTGLESSKLRKKGRRRGITKWYNNTTKQI
jgi:hypothetical protein